MKKATLSLIALCILMTFIYLVFNENPLLDTLCFSGENFMRGFFWTPITSLFIHANLMHLIGNILFLYIFGGTLEREVGSAKTVLVFLLGGVLSYAIGLHFYGFSVRMIGASAAIFTLVSAVMLIKPLKFSWLFLMPLGLVAAIYFLYNLFAVYYSIGETNVGYFGHIAGFLIGIPFGILWSHGKWKRNLLITIALLIFYLLIVSLCMKMLY
ncbi:MAG: rhomboid family intramembrane serine protease [Candidatus Bathyarchaeia archaeon]